METDRIICGDCLEEGLPRQLGGFGAEKRLDKHIYRV